MMLFKKNLLFQTTESPKLPCQMSKIITQNVNQKLLVA